MYEVSTLCPTGRRLFYNFTLAQACELLFDRTDEELESLTDDACEKLIRIKEYLQAQIG